MTGKQLWRARKAYGMSRAQIGAILHIDGNQIWTYEQRPDHRPIPAQRGIRLALIFTALRRRYTGVLNPENFCPHCGGTGISPEGDDHAND